jgi:S1-C subfamily serine protease
MDRRLLLTLGVSIAAALPSIASAQAEARAYVSPGRGFAYSFGEEDRDRAVVGITTSTGSARDTLGVLVSSVTAGGPAEKAGIEEGNRIASINGVNLKLSPADIDDWDMSSIMSRRLTRELGKLKPGDEVELRIYSSGQVKTVKVKTVSADSLYRTDRRVRFDDDERAALGVGLGSSGSKRDTLGVLVTWLDDEGPAAKAGIEEGNRIAAINNVDLRVSRDDAGDAMVSSIKSSRLQRELAKLKPGDEVELRVYGDGKTRTLKVKTVAASKLSRSRGGSIFMDGFPRISIPAIPPMPNIAPMAAPRVRITRISI